MPDVLGARLEAALAVLGDACATYLYLLRDCEKPEPQRPCCWGWNDGLPIVSYRHNGLSPIAVQASVNVGGTVLRAQASLTVAAVGYLITADGVGHEFFEGDCPERCEDNRVRGKMAVELTGSLSISSNLVNYWNRGIGTLQRLVGAVLSGPVASLVNDALDRDRLQAPPGGGLATCSLRGTGDHGGIVYDLGDFSIPHS